MLGLLADWNIEGQVGALVRICASEPLREYWVEVGVLLYTYKDLDLQEDAPDPVVWRLCQARNILLMTANRNQRGPESLEGVIRQEGTRKSLPVLTLSDPVRVTRDRQYAQCVAERLVEILYDVDLVRGAGRLYLP